MPRARVVLCLHAYAWSGPGAWSPKQFTQGLVKKIMQARDTWQGLSLYGEMVDGPAPGALEAQFDKVRTRAPSRPIRQGKNPGALEAHPTR